MDTVILFSSRTCSNSDNYKHYLLSQSKMIKDGSINLSTNSFLEQDYSALENVAQANFSDRRYLADNYCLDENDLDLVDSVLQKIHRSRHPELYRGTNLSPDVAKQAIQENRKLLESMNLLGPVTDVPFRFVYQRANLLNGKAGQKLSVYGVHEIFEGDQQEQVEEARPKWCDLLISYVLTRNPDAKSVYLFLHDKDLAGFSDSSLTLVDGAKECLTKNLIHNSTLELLDNKALSIVFFKHGNAMITDLIGPFTEDVVIDDLFIQNKVKTIIDYLKGVYDCRKLADEILKKENQESK